MSNEKRIPMLQDPIAFGDIRGLEEAERKKLEARFLQLKDLSPRKRSLSPAEMAELKEIEQKLATDDVVDPLFKAVQRGLTPNVGDHKQGLLPSQQTREALHDLFAVPEASRSFGRRPDWAVLVNVAGFDGNIELADGLKSLTGQTKEVNITLLGELSNLFDNYVASLADPARTKRGAKKPGLAELAKAIESVSDAGQFGRALADAVRENLVAPAESLVDWALAFYQGVAKPAGRTLNSIRALSLIGQLTDDEKLLAGVLGILEADREEPPPYHLLSAHPEFAPDAARRTQRFGKALFTAQGEFSTNKGLFDAVLPVLVKLGERGPTDVVNANEWARVVRYLLKRGIKEDEPQLGRRVDEALNNIQNVGDDLPPSLIAIDLPDLEDETTDKEIVEDNIRALQPAYFAAMFEELKAFQVVDKLVELFQNGILPIGKGDAGDSLFKYWKETSTRVSEPERRSFYARTLGFVGGEDGGMPNREFSDLWMRFVSGVSSFIRQNNVDELLRTQIPGAISQQQVRKAGRDLAANLSLHGYGMAHFMATELQKQVKDVIKLLSDPDIKNAYGARDMWQVIDQVAAFELGGSKNSVRYRTMAASGAIIFAWLAKKSRDLSSTSFTRILDMDEIRNPTPRQSGTKATTDPTDFDLVNACEQWLAVTGTQEEQVESYAQPKESPNMTSKPIQIPSIARETLESLGVPAMGLGANGSKYR
jgi:hypothetical protein